MGRQRCLAAADAAALHALRPRLQAGRARLQLQGVRLVAQLATASSSFIDCLCQYVLSGNLPVTSKVIVV